MLADKSSRTSVDGLNQKFLLYKEGQRNKVKVVGATDKTSLGFEILSRVNVDNEVDLIYNTLFPLNEKQIKFDEVVKEYSDAYLNDRIIYHGLGGRCKACEYNATEKQMQSGFKSGSELFFGFFDSKSVLSN